MPKGKCTLADVQGRYTAADLAPDQSVSPGSNLPPNRQGQGTYQMMSKEGHSVYCWGA